MGVSDDLDLMQELLGVNEDSSVLEDLNKEFNKVEETVAHEIQPNNKMESFGEDITNIGEKPKSKKKRSINFNKPKAAEEIEEKSSIEDFMKLVEKKKLENKKLEALQSDSLDVEWNLDTDSLSKQQDSSKIEEANEENEIQEESNFKEINVDESIENSINYEESEDDLFLKSGSSPRYKEEWLETYRKAQRSRKNNYFSEKIKSGKFRINDDHMTEILPEVDIRDYDNIDDLIRSRKVVK